MNAAKLARYALLTAAAFALSYVEHLLPPLTPVAGVKPGLANIITVYVLFTYGAGGAFTVSCVRAVLSALLFAGPMSIPYALAGAVLSIGAMWALGRFHPRVFSLMGVSVAGAFCHNCGQLLVASAFLQGFAVFAYFPWMTLLSVPTGIFVGFCARFLVKVAMERR